MPRNTRLRAWQGVIRPRAGRFSGSETCLPLKHQGTVLLTDGIGDDESALITTRLRISISVLKFLQLLPVATPERGCVWLNMDIVHMTSAIGETGNGVEKRRTDDVAELDSGMVFTMSESRQFNQALKSLWKDTEGRGSNEI